MTAGHFIFIPAVLLVGVVIGWVFFRAKSVASAEAILGAMVGHGGWLAVPGATLGARLANLAGSLDWDSVAEAGISTDVGAADGALTDLNDAERIELRRLLREAMAHRGA